MEVISHFLSLRNVFEPVFSLQSISLYSFVHIQHASCLTAPGLTRHKVRYIGIRHLERRHNCPSSEALGHPTLGTSKPSPTLTHNLQPHYYVLQPTPYVQGHHVPVRPDMFSECKSRDHVSAVHTSAPYDPHIAAYS
jgi:hypothetical protein